MFSGRQEPLPGPGLRGVCWSRSFTVHRINSYLQYMHMYIYIYIHTYTYTYIHTYISCCLYLLYRIITYIHNTLSCRMLLSESWYWSYYMYLNPVFGAYLNPVSYNYVYTQYSIVSILRIISIIMCVYIHICYNLRKL